VDEWGISKLDWPLLFHGWDSAWYIKIAKTGYSYPAYAFLPAYPFMIRIAYLLIGDWILSSFIVSFLLGVAAVPMFQLLAENYMSKDQAAIVTLVFALFPPVFFFTSIAYTESLFLVATIGTWLFLFKEEMVFLNDSCNRRKLDEDLRHIDRSAVGAAIRRREKKTNCSSRSTR